MTGRLRTWAPWIVLVLATALLSAVLAGTPTGEGLDPANPGPTGTQALVKVLQQQGVQVETARGVGSLPGELGVGTTLVLSSTTYLGPTAGADLLQRARGADRVVVLVSGADPEDDPASVLGLDVQTSWPSGARLSGDCTSPLVREGDEVSRWDAGLQSTPGQPDVQACFPPSVGHNAGGAKAGALLTFARTPQRPEVVLVGFPSALTNEHVTDDAHAALGLRLLGQSPHLVWVIPAPADAAADLDSATSLWQVLPRNLTPSLAILGGALLALAVWRGRRLGPVVTEPLPAVVLAAQTTRSRGRLYRQAKDREHALAALQAGTRRRLAPRLGLARRASPAEISRAVADATGRPFDEVDRLLTRPQAVDDTAFVTTARELRSLEEGLQP